ncbi:MAG: 30S ribosomal protein S12 methylthiotransferase RimO [Fimbriimonadaceae bacterium]
MPSASCDGTTTPPPERRSSRRSLSTDKTFYIVHLGCAKNLYDAELMAGALVDSGWRESADPEGAQAILINSCGFIEAAISESVETVLEYTAGYPDSAVVMTGCLAQRYPDQIAMEIPELAGVFGNRRPEAIPQFLSRVAGPSAPRRPSGKPTFWDAPPGDPDWRHRTAPRPTLYTPAGTAYVKIAEGCTHNCAFCAIPQIRGTLRSRSVDAVVREVEDLLSRGIREINLIAQDVTQYGYDLYREFTLPRLLRELNAVDGIEWIRLLYFYPNRLTDEVIEAVATLPKVLRYIDIPLQHVHPDTLRRMKRPWDGERYLKVFEKVRAAMPDAAIRTTFIVGFPGETEEEFQSLLQFVREAELDRVGAFLFSREPGTPSHDMEGQVSTRVKQRRYERLMKAQRAISLAKNKAYVGETLNCLVEEERDGWLAARSFRDAPEIDGWVYVKGDAKPGDFAEVKVTGHTEYDLFGETGAAAPTQRRKLSPLPMKRAKAPL